MPLFMPQNIISLRICHLVSLEVDSPEIHHTIVMDKTDLKNLILPYDVLGFG